LSRNNLNYNAKIAIILVIKLIIIDFCEKKIINLLLNEFVMKLRKMYLILVIFIICITFVSGQNTNSNNLKNTIYFGYPATFLDPPDFGFYIAFNPHLLLNQYFSYEFQFSYGYGKYKSESGWFKHNGGYINLGNLLSGFRLYFFSREKKVNPYINLLAGVSYYLDKELAYDDSLRTKSDFGIGISGGVYLQLYQNFNIGIAMETYPSMVFKGGYTF